MTKTIKFVDLFAGMGGVRIGFEQAFNEAGFETECVLTSEIKKHAIRTLRENFNYEPVKGDICKVKSEHIPDFDFLSFKILATSKKVFLLYHRILIYCLLR